jgi:predicted Zn-dependent peptidase
MEESKRDWTKIFIGLLIASLAFFSFFFTVYQFMAHPENREHFIKKLKNIRNEPVFPRPGERGD